MSPRQLLVMLIAYVAFGLAFPRIALGAIGGLVMMVGSIALATLLASPVLLLAKVLERRNHRK